MGRLRKSLRGEGMGGEGESEEVRPLDGLGYIC